MAIQGQPALLVRLDLRAKRVRQVQQEQLALPVLEPLALLGPLVIRVRQARRELRGQDPLAQRVLELPAQLEPRVLLAQAQRELLDRRERLVQREFRGLLARPDLALPVQPARRVSTALRESLAQPELLAHKAIRVIPVRSEALVPRDRRERQERLARQVSTE